MEQSDKSIFLKAHLRGHTKGLTCFSQSTKCICEWPEIKQAVYINLLKVSPVYIANVIIWGLFPETYQVI